MRTSSGERKPPGGKCSGGACPRQGVTISGGQRKPPGGKCSGGAAPCISPGCVAVDAAASLARWIGAGLRQEILPVFSYGSSQVEMSCQSRSFVHFCQDLIIHLFRL